jgi:hypothetical protein
MAIDIKKDNTKPIMTPVPYPENAGTTAMTIAKNIMKPK